MYARLSLDAKGHESVSADQVLLTDLQAAMLSFTNVQFWTDLEIEFAVICLPRAGTACDGATPLRPPALVAPRVAQAQRVCATLSDHAGAIMPGRRHPQRGPYR